MAAETVIGYWCESGLDVAICFFCCNQNAVRAYRLEPILSHEKTLSGLDVRCVVCEDLILEYNEEDED